MSERGVRVVFSPETPRQPSTRTDLRGTRNHSNVATNERTSNAGRTARSETGKAHRLNGDLTKHLRKRMPDEDRIKRTSIVFAMLADRQRLKIVLALTAAEELCVGEVAHVLGTSASVASHHLRKLRDLGILEDRGAGKYAYYRLRQRSVARVVVTALGAARI
jgi:ArsR family transcriptional regulator, lead/cadmium/zinc/bismuth-responsive transcriptional repressor